MGETNLFEASNQLNQLLHKMLQGHSTETSTFGMARWLQFFFSFFVQLFQDHMYHFFVTGVTFFSNIKRFYEYYFSIFFFSTCSQSYRKIMKMHEIRRLGFYLFNVTEKAVQ